MLLSYFAIALVAVGVVGFVLKTVGFSTLGFLAQLLGYLFGGSEPGSRNDAP